MAEKTQWQKAKVPKFWPLPVWNFCLHPLAGRVITQSPMIWLVALPVPNRAAVFLLLVVLLEVSTLQVMENSFVCYRKTKFLLKQVINYKVEILSRNKLERWQMKVATLPKTGYFTVSKASEDFRMFYLENNTVERAHLYKSFTGTSICLSQLFFGAVNSFERIISFLFCFLWLTIMAP